MTEEWANRACRLCRYWEHMQHSAGECRRKSPGVHNDTFSDGGSWPITKRDDWCGEFRDDATKEEDVEG